MTQPTTDKGVRGFELDIHVAFAEPLSVPEARRVLLALDRLTAELYQPHPRAMPAGLPVDDSAGVPSARLTGPLTSADEVRGGLESLLPHARYLEVGVRGFLRSASGQTDWMPWRRTVVLSRRELGAQGLEQVAFEEGVKYVLE